jgi:ankyrin repeat protein
MIHFLISRGADVNAVNDHGVTPLHALVVRGDRDLVRLLADSGAEVNTVDSLGQSPLHSAVLAEDLDMVCLLLNRPRYVPRPGAAAGGDGDGDENENENDNDNAAPDEEDDRDPEEIERELRRKKRLEERERKEREEREREREEQERLEAEKWAKPDVIDKAGWAPLHYAAARGYAEIARVIIAAGADMNIIDARTGECPLHKAILHGRAQVVRYLEGADVNIRSKANVPLVQVAAMEGFSAIFRWLVEQGGDYRFTDANGWTLLHHAAANDHLSVVRYLVSELAVDIHAKNKDGLKPLMLAHDQGIKRFLQRRMLGDLSGAGEDATLPRNSSTASGFAGNGGLSESGSNAGLLVRPDSSVAGEAPSLPGSSRPSTALSGLA